MTTLLKIDASARHKGSHSREVAEHFTQQWQAAHPQGEVIVRDLVDTPLPHISEQTIGGFFSPEPTSEQLTATALSDELIGEIMAADVIVISAPMYNFSLPSSLKAWIDQVARIGKTFSFDPEAGFGGLVADKQVYLVTATGAVFSEPGMSDMDHMTGYLKFILGFLGMSVTQHWSIEGASMSEDILNTCKQTARTDINQLWSTTA